MNVAIIYGGGHASVVMHTAKRIGYYIIGYYDDYKTTDIDGVHNIGNISEINIDQPLIIAIGDNKIRRDVAIVLGNVNFVTLIDPSSIIADNVEIGEGTFISLRVIINPGVKIGKHCIINTGVIIEHNTVIGDYTHIAPGAVICGSVKIGSDCMIGAGSVVINGITIGSRTIIGASSNVVKDIGESLVAYGNPCREIRSNNLLS